ncbi:lipocalin family protein [Comamonas aquatica]|uniref:lipocalin family protein n=1 Tax=Comamonas aquatica TaxID=225991 RepID=UPI0005A96436|nr:lipocalin family protein [Comamonas aquatica]
MQHLTRPLPHQPAAPTARPRLLRWLASALLGAALLTGCASTSPPPGLQPVTGFDLQRYQGRWYELARLDHAFERGLRDVSATYTPQPDGSVQVINRGRQAASGQWREAVGKALFTGPSSTASLKVSFFGPFYGGYHVVGLDADYRWALVVGTDTGYAWILARDTQLPRATLQRIVAQAQSLGIDTQAFIWVDHTDTDSPTPAQP